uniref:Lipoyl-binding domain-containing protein n=1 Tax=Tetradesmus obliquus TaxID=3088 RepID=A0A383VZ78_TETOB|eukprot:jgi/Sobl393_1/8673/SZX70755.1
MQLRVGTQCGRVCSSRASVRRAPSCAPLRASQTDKTETKKKQAEFFDGADDAGTPSTAEVKALLDTLVADTDIAELRLKAGSFQLSVRRSVDGPEPPAAAAAAPAAAAAAAPAGYAAAPSPSMAPALSLAPMPYMSVDENAAPEESMDEGLLYCVASKVGTFRRGRYAAGKKVGKGNVANVGDRVKKGATLGYIEQLGTFVEVKAPQEGEVVQFRAEEGDPVEYGQAVVVIAPFFAVAEAGVTEYR